jgi:uncharacterized protein (TIGR02246 family)
MTNSATSVIALYSQMLDAWNRRDANGFARVFAQSASVVGFDGSQMNGRPEITSSLARIFADHPTAQYIAKVRDVRALADGVALLRTVVGMVPPGAAAVDPALNAIQSLIFVVENERAEIALLQNTPALFHGRPRMGKELTEELGRVLLSGQTVDDGSNTPS